MTRIMCLLCKQLIPFDESVKDDSVKSMLDKEVTWEVMKASLDRRLCESCREKAKC